MTEKKVVKKASAPKKETAVKAEAPKKAPAAPKAKTGKTLKVKMIGGLRGTTKIQRATVAGLGLKKMNQVRELEDTDCVRGMIKKIPHLVEVVE